LDRGVILRVNYSVSEITFSREVDVSEFVFEIKTSSHFGLIISLPASIIMAINILIFIILSLLNKKPKT
jgi:hypothetical protein